MSYDPTPEKVQATGDPFYRVYKHNRTDTTPTLTYYYSDQAVQLDFGCRFEDQEPIKYPPFAEWGKQHGFVFDRICNAINWYVSVEDFQGESLFKSYGSNVFSAAGCTFKECGNGVPTIPVADKPHNAADFARSNIIQGQWEAIFLHECRFVHCCNVLLWQAIVYAGYDHLTIQNCLFAWCGLVFSSYSPGSVHFGNNEVVLGPKIQDPCGRMVATPIGYFRNGARHSIERNIIGGTTTGALWIGYPSPEFCDIDNNDYSQLKHSGPFASLGDGRILSWQQWQEAGFDRNSKPPVLLP